MKKILALPFLASLTLACGGSVTVPNGTSTGSTLGGSGGASVTSSSSAGGAGGGTSTTSSSTSSASSTGGPLCAGLDTFIDVVGIGAPQHFTEGCPDAPVLGNPVGPVAYQPKSGGILPELDIIGCASAGPGPSIRLREKAVSAPGLDTMATGEYRDAALNQWSSMAAGDVTVTLDHYEDVGGVVEGSYTAKLTSQLGTIDVSGAFRVCHVEQLPPP